MLHVKKTPETRAKRTDWSFISLKKIKLRKPEQSEQTGVLFPRKK
jgi:hypothetical protein